MLGALMNLTLSNKATSTGILNACYKGWKCLSPPERNLPICTAQLTENLGPLPLPLCFKSHPHQAGSKSVYQNPWPALPYIFLGKSMGFSLLTALGDGFVFLLHLLSRSPACILHHAVWKCWCDVL